ncbi:uncharacterized protein [Rutidosis leptorrhynchoides]|uniref:uncharacterized protein n=1 Tax=Rutidosis leptorrhynchoides TaxID=125765 RepID=UPI003A99EF10
MKDCNICVRVHINWRKTYWRNPNNASSLEMILVDTEGMKIRATIEKQFMNFFGDTFKEGEHFELSNFHVRKHDDDLKLIGHDCKIQIERTTKVHKTAAFDIEIDVYRVVTYDDVHNLLKVKFEDIFDVVGNGQKMRCALWNHHATHLHEYVSALDDAKKAKVVIFMHNCKVKEWNGAPQVSNLLWGTRVYINQYTAKQDNVIGADEISNAINVGMNVTTNMDKFTTPTAYVLEEAGLISEASTFVVRGTVLDIVKTDGWYSYKCCKDNNKVFKNFDVDMEIDFLDCVQCGVVTDVYPRILLTIRLGDKTGNCDCVLFDSQLPNMLNKSVNWINNRAKVCEIPSLFPQEIQQLKQKKYAFIIKLTLKNLEFLNSGLIVSDVTDEIDVLNALDDKLRLKDTEYLHLDSPPVVSIPVTLKVPKVEVLSDSEASASTWTPVSVDNKRKSESPLEEANAGTPIGGTAKAIGSLKIPRMEDI